MKFKFKTLFIGMIIVAILFAIGSFAVPLIFSPEARNKLARSKVSYKVDDYRVTCVLGDHKKVYEFRGKVTSDPKGYYFFWHKMDGEKKYTQLPIAHTIIDEM